MSTETTDATIWTGSNGHQMRRVETNQTSPPRAEVHGTDMRDSKGRQIGFIARDQFRDVKPKAEARTLWPLDKPLGVYFGYRVQATRDGVTYGASQPAHWFRTGAERDTAKAKHVSRVIRAAAKKFGAAT